MQRKRDSTDTSKSDLYRRVFELSPNPIAFFRDGVYVECNSALLDLYGLSSKDEVIGKPAGSFSPPRQPDGKVSPDEAGALIRECCESGPLTVSWSSIRSDGITISANITLLCVDETEPSLVVGFLHDVTELKESKTEILNREAYLSEVIENSPVAIMVFNGRTGEVSRINRTGRNMVGLPEGSMQGLRAGDLLDVPPDWFRILREMKRRGQTSREVVLRKFNGEPIHAMITCRQNPGSVEDLLAWAVDLTEQKRIHLELRASRERFRKLAKHAPVGIFIADESGACKFANPRAVQLCGVDEERIMGDGWAKNLHPDDRQIVFDAWQSFVETGAPFSVEYRFLGENGKVTWVVGAAVPYVGATGAENTYLGTITDITKIKKIELELENSRNEALKANNAKSEFLSRMSHELRTPMNAILGFGQLLEMQGERLTLDQKDAVKHILAGGEHLLELIEDVLDFSRIESGHISLNIQRVSTNDALQRSLALITPLARQAGVQVEPPADSMPDVIADPHRLRQVLVNLLSNAIKYNHRRGSIRIHGESVPENMVRIHVVDNGEGIRHEDRDRLFKPFERITESSLMVQGTGIGLSLSQQLLELMGGKIDFVSAPGEGSDFWIDLPAVRREDHSANPAALDVDSKNLPEISGLKILYIEDHLASIELMMEVMRVFEDCEVITATNAADGIAIAKTSRPDLILMDINLSGMDGIEALKLLKGEARTQSIPVIALSASALQRVIDEGLDAGFEQFLIKPLKLGRLFDAIRSVLDQR